MKIFQSKNQLSLDGIRNIDEAACGPQLWTWELAERVQVNVVETSGNVEDNDLG